MKNFLYVVVIGLCIYSCSSTKNNNNSVLMGDSEVSGDTVRIANDTLEYEVIIIEPGFNSWLKSSALPRGYYSQSYLETHNRNMVMEYNSRAMNPIRYGDLYPQRINYENRIDYGYEVNYLLYNYLIFFQKRYNQKL